MRALKLYQALWLVAVCLFCKVRADVRIVAPKQGAKFTASSGSVQIEIAWVNNGKGVPMNDVHTWDFLICTGPNDAVRCAHGKVGSIKGSDLTGSKYTVTVPNTVGTNGAYFIQMYGTMDREGHFIVYTPRFMLEGMVGSEVADTNPSLDPPSADVDLAVDSKSFSVDYTLQTGRTRYAPMQLQPGTTVTAKTWTIRFPSSSVSYFSTAGRDLKQQSTITPGWSYTFTFIANPATPAPMPSENGPWYDRRSKIASPRKVNFRRAGGLPVATADASESL